MIRPKKLSFCNIGRFVEPQTIYFDRLSQLNQIDAENNLTGGSSGSGKSTIAHARDWLLGLSSLPTGVLQSRLTKEHIWVEEEFDWDDKKVIIKRGRKLSIVIDGVETTGSSKLTEELLDQILGMPRDLFHKIVHRQQGENGFFLQQTPAQMNAFLTDCLNLAPIRSKIDVIDLKLKELAQAKEKAQNDLQASQAALEAIKSAQTSLGSIPTTDVTDGTVSLLKAKLELAESTLEALKGAHRLEREDFQLKKPVLDTVPYDHTQINALETEIKALEVQINAELDKERSRQVEINAEISAIKLDANSKISVLRLEHGNKMAETKAAITKCDSAILLGKASKEIAITLAGKIKALRSGICHTCEQSWITQKAKQEEEKLLAELSQHKTNIEASAKAALESEEHKAKATSLNQQLEIVIAEINSSISAQIAEFTEQAKPQTSPEFLAFKEKVLVLAKLKSTEYVKEDEYKKEQTIKNKKLQDAFYVEQGVLIEKHRLVWESFSKEVSETRSQYEQQAQALASHLIALNRHQTSLDSLKKKEEEMNSKVVQMNSNVVDLTEKLEIAEEAKRCLKSYLSCSFDDALDGISETSTRILRAVPTMANATVRLVGQKESNSGSVKDQVNVILDNDGEIGIPIKSLSGGEKSALDLCIDLAVTEFIEERTNNGCEILFLDEIFNGFDSLGIEHALEMLKTFGVNKKMLLIEHDGVAKEFVQNKITVVREGETSYIRN